MLTLQERHQVLLFFRQFCRSKLLPADVDAEGWELRQGFNTALRTKWISKLFCALFAAHASYKVASLVLVLLSANAAPLHQIIIHAVLATAFTAFVYWYYVLYIQHGEVFAEFLRMTLTGKIGEGNANKVVHTYS